MNKWNVATLLLAVCALFAAAPALIAADPPQSHRPLPGVDGSFDEKELAERLQPAQEMSFVRTLAARMLKNPDEFPRFSDKKKGLLEQLLKNQDAQKLLKDPEMKELLREALKNPKLSNQQHEELGKQLDQVKPEDLKKLADEIEKHPNNFKSDDKVPEELRKLAEKKKADLKPEDLAKWKDLAKKLGENPNLPNDQGELDRLKHFLPEVTPPPTVPSVQPGVPPVQPPDKQPQPPTGPHVPQLPPPPLKTKMISANPLNPQSKPETAPPAPQNVNDLTATGFLKLADWLHDIDPSDEHLDFLAEMLRNMGEGNGEDQGALDSVGKTADWLGSLHIGEWHFSDDTAETAGSWFDKFNGSSLPTTDNMSSGSSLSSSSSSGPIVPSGSSSLDLEKLAGIFVWTVLLAIVGFAVWRLLLWYRTGAVLWGRGISRRWPVRPGEVSTRGDLVRAFEYLALTLLGIDAQHRHHLDLARRLGGAAPQADDTRREAAQHLAHLYELARYAPEDEPLPEAELVAARRDLSFLAGAVAA